MIAGVFMNRLRRGLLLQSCATVQYALGERKQRLLYKDLQVESPYNTYRYKGLPPTPICNPGRASLLAVLEPVQTDYLYFFAKADGSHIFSRTYREHLQAVYGRPLTKERRLNFWRNQGYWSIPAGCSTSRRLR